MVHGGLCGVVPLLLLNLLVIFVHTEIVPDSALTAREHQDTWSGDPPSDVTTTVPLPDVTFTIGYDEIFTSSQPLDEGFLGPGAITAIVIAVFLGVSVLLTLIVITLRKFMAS